MKVLKAITIDVEVFKKWREKYPLIPFSRWVNQKLKEEVGDERLDN